MKIAIGYKIISGPWGGGNRFAISLSKYLESMGHEVSFDLRGKPDIILLTDPRSRLSNVSFGAGAIIRHLLFKNPDAIVIHRINEADERKNTNFMNKALIKANYCADYTVFVGSWLTQLKTWKNSLHTPFRTILNGADQTIFNPEGFVPWNGDGVIRLVTHHWGGNWMKGFDVYSKLDKMLEQPEWKDKVDFTYIGNLPKGFKFKNAKYIYPLDGKELADELQRHHAYITASINEPGGNHQNEAGACGLPLLYRNSGCLPEYCHNSGLMFDTDSFEESLIRFINDYDNIIISLPKWQHTSKKTCEQYLQLFEELLSQRETVKDNRNLLRDPWVFIKNQISFISRNG